MNLHVTVLCLLWFCCVTNAAQILGGFPFPARSHFLLGDRIFKELADRGHNVTVISPYKEKTQRNNFNQVLVENVFGRSAEMKSDLFNHINYNIPQRVQFLETLGLNFTELALNDTNVKSFLKERNHFDLVIIHHFNSDAYNGFCYRYKAPCISVSPLSVPNWFSNKVGNSAPPSYVPQLLVSYSRNMNFWQRTFNSMVYLLSEISHRVYLYPEQNRLLQKYFPGAPHLDELYYNMSLILYTGHVSVSDVSPHLPNTIDIAGYHVSPPKKLPEDLQEFLDNAVDGVIYFSMGSNLLSRDFPISLRNSILNIFSKLKQRVVWKFENDLPNKPTNVLIRSWFPQQDILAHPNVILFITHGGLLSVIEAIYFGKPIVGLPVYSDQGLNSKRVEEAGYGKFIPFAELSEESFGKVLNEMIHNPIYMSKAKARSRIMHDQPLPPLQRAIFWIEYVLRHRGAPHLKSSALSLSWYQYFLLDIIFGSMVFCGLIVMVLKAVWRNYIFYKPKLKRY